MATRQGTALTEEELKGIDSSEIAETKAYEEGEVEGQALYRDVVVCPACGAARVAVLDTREWTYFDCSCGVTFRA